LENILVDLVKGFKGKGLQVKVDDRNYMWNGVKYFEKERKSVPLRIELGLRDDANDVYTIKLLSWYRIYQAMLMSSTERASLTSHQIPPPHHQ